MKIVQKGNYDGNIINTVIENRSIEDVETFLNPTNENMLESKDLHNIELAAVALIAQVGIGADISILVDADADGYMSSSIMYQYIKKLNPQANLNYILHTGKAHGITEDIINKIVNLKIDLLIVPDAGSNDHEALDKLITMGIDVIIIDHHEIEDISKLPPKVIVVNNQTDLNVRTNKDLVGAGMVLKYCEMMDQMLVDKFADEFYDLTAIGQIGDASDISKNEIRYIVFKGINDIRNKFVEEVLMDHFGSLDNIAPKDFSFSVIPLINAMTRVGTQEEKELLFRALNNINPDEIYRVNKKKKNKATGKFETNEIEMNIYEYTLHICKSVKNRQASIVKKILANLRENIDNTGGIVIGILKDGSNLSITGLVANKLATKYQKPALLLYFDGVHYRGSGRGYIKVMPSLKDWSNKTNLVEYAQGHANAFGISIPKENYSAFKENTKNIESQDIIYEVDLIMDEKIDKDIILKLNDNKYLFGGSFENASLAFTNIEVDKRFIKQRGQMLNIFHKGIDIVMFAAPNGLYEDLVNNFDAFITCDFVGEPSVNSWKDEETPQLILTDMVRKKKIAKSALPKEITAADLVF